MPVQLKYILAKTIGKVEIGADGYPTGELRPEKVPDNVEASFIAYSSDQSEVLIKCFDDTIDVKLYGDSATELSATDAKAKYEAWQNAHDVSCKCWAKGKIAGTHKELNTPCLANALSGVSHNQIDESLPKITVDYDVWKTEFLLGKYDNKVALFESRLIREKKRAKLIARLSAEDIANLSKSNTLDDAIEKETLTTAEIGKVTERAKVEVDNTARYRLIKHPLKKVKVAF